MTLKQENGIALLLAAVPVVLFLVLADGLADRFYTHIGGSDGLWVSKAGFAKAIWFFGALQYGLGLSLKAWSQDRLAAFSPATVRLLAGSLLSAAMVALILSNRA